MIDNIKEWYDNRQKRFHGVVLRVEVLKTGDVMTFANEYAFALQSEHKKQIIAFLDELKRKMVEVKR